MKNESINGKNYKKVLFYVNVSIIVFIILPIIVMLFLSYNIYRSNIYGIVSQNLLSTLEYKKKSLETWLNERKSDLSFISSQKDILKKNTQTKVFNQLNLLKNAYSCYDKILLVDTNGMAIYSTDRGTYNFKDEKYFQRAIQGENGFSSIHLSFVMKEPAFFGYTPIKKNSDIIAILVSQIKLDYISEITQELILGETGEVYLVDANKILLTKSKFIEGGVLHHKVESIAVEKALKGISGVDEYLDYRGVKVFGAYDLIPDMHCVIIIEQDKDEALESFHRFRDKFIPITIIILIVLLLLVFFVSKRIQNYLEKRDNEILRHKEKMIYSEQMASVGMMSTALAHEINNPLTTIKVLIQSIFSELPKNDEKKKDLSVILEEIDSISKLSYRFLQYARPKEPEIKGSNLNEIIKKIIELLNYQIDKNKMELVLMLNENIPNVWMDSSQIGQVILNILLNAIQAEPYQGKIEIKSACDEEFCIVKITNFNTYLPEDLRVKIFEPFFTTKSKGTGLGLAISRTIMEKHSGIIECESNTSEGTSFIIKLPFKKSNSSATN